MHFGISITYSILLSFMIFVNTRRCRIESISLIKSFLRPSQIILMYTIIFILFGSLYFNYGTVLNKSLEIETNYWKFTPIIIITISIFISILSSNYSKNKILFNDILTRRLYFKDIFPWEIIGFVFALSSLYFESAELILISTSFYIAGSAYGRFKSTNFLLFLFAGIYILLPIFSFGKRLLIFPIIIVILIIFRDGFISKRNALLFLLLSIATIIPFSIMRGYGNFGADNFSDAFLNIGNYVYSSEFISSLGNNTEVVPFYFHGINAIQLTWQSGDYVWGETLLKMFFLGSSIYGFEDGFRSSIEIYTNNYDTLFRSEGGSYPVMLYSEIFMNFGIMSIIIFPILLILLDKFWIYALSIKKSVSRFTIEVILLYCSLILARGSSFDIYLYQMILLGLPVGLVWSFERAKYN